MRSRLRCLCAVVAALIMAAAPAGRGTAIAQTARPWINEEEQTRLVAALRNALPRGWIVKPVGLGRVPDDWRSLDTRIFEVEGVNGQQAFRVSFVPADWIGIRRPDPRRSRLSPWQGVLQDGQYKALSPGLQFPPFQQLRNVPIYVALTDMGMNLPSLINRGSSDGFALFGSRLAEVDEQTRSLVSRFCTTRECVDEAAYSLIVLGVPARTLTLECAERAAGYAQQACASVLGYWDTPEALSVLNELVARRSTSSETRRYAAWALEQIADPSSGPALGEALQLTPSADRNAVMAIAQAIARVRYRPAAPEILSRLETETDDFAQRWYARVLGALQYEPAVRAIERLCETTNISADWILGKQRDPNPPRYRGPLPEVALLRITGPWGQPSDGIRLLILPPENPASSSKIEIAKLIENVGDDDVRILHVPGVWIVDGKEISGIDSNVIDGSVIVRARDVDVGSTNLGKVLSTPGSHTVQYRLRDATSNRLTLQVR